jgi:hypothetical protein
MNLGRVCKALDKLGSFPIFTFESPKSPGITIDGKSVGWVTRKPYRIKLDLILAKSSPENIVSSTGEQSTRRIVRGDSVKTELWVYMENTISEMAFRYRTFAYITCKIRNLYIYSAGTGLEWRREAPLSDRHQATVLVALDTDWTGGCLLLRRNGIEIRHAMPRQTVFFDNETEYAIEPVTDGNLVLLHYDILVHDREFIMIPRVELGEDDEYTEEIGVWSGDEYRFRQLKNSRSPYETQPRGFLYGADHEKHMGYILRIVKKLLITKYNAVGLALHHHYGEHPILPELLQQPDTWMYEAVTECGYLDVSLRPVLLHQQTDDYGCYRDGFAYPFDQPMSTDGDTEEDEEVKTDVGIPESAVLFLHAGAPLCEVVSEEHIENHRDGDEKYFVCAMFLSLKDDEMRA